MTPIYIPSKGRADTRLTAKALDRMGVRFRVVVEEEEYRAYAESVGADRLLVLDMAYKRSYDAQVDLQPGQSPGSGPARNFIWDHAEAEGHAWHWIMDDNIKAFYRLNRNLKVPVSDGTIFRCMEEFCARYSNVAMAGPNYFMFASRKAKIPPATFNTRIYSCNLIKTASPFRWRCRYNEDTDLSLRMLKAGYCTVLFNAFLQEKATTQTMRGGNTDAFYAEEGTLPKSKMLVDLHPDVAKISNRWGRVHHFVDYRPFRVNKLLLLPGVKIPKGVDDFGMRLIKVEDSARGGGRKAAG